MKRYFLNFAALIPFCYSVHSQSITSEARSYVNVPKGAEALGLYSSTARANFPGSSNYDFLEESGINNNMILMRYTRFFPVAGKTSGINVILPYTFVDGNIPKLNIDGNNSGFGDISFTFGMNIIGAPALSLPDFIKYRQNTILSYTVQVTGPTGLYDADSKLNIGTNRWTFKPELGLSQAFAKNFIIDIYANSIFATSNTDISNGGKKEQKPLYGLETHLSYNFTPAVWASIDFTSAFGGETKIDGINQDNAQRSLKLGGTFKATFNKKNLFAFYVQQTIYNKDHKGPEVTAFIFSYMRTIAL